MLCPSCSTECPGQARFCLSCGAALLSRSAASSAATVAIAEETRTSTSTIDEGRFPAGTVLAGRYRILGLLGRGGMGEVYRASDLILNQPVALKFLSAAGRASDAALARLRNEVRVARQVSHPNVCRVYDIGTVEGLNFISMEYIDGEDLDSLLRRIGRLPQDKALEFARRLCAGLAAAHERGILHRDLKPANIMIDGRGHVRITDFGLAVLAGEISPGDLRSGTPDFMAPEQKSGAEVTVRSDLYSLGVVFYEMFTGKRRDASRTTPSEHVRDLDPAIERVMLKCLENDPRQRPASALAVAMALPGGDPVAAALAAGETPSPEMVAAWQQREGFTPRAAALCFAGIVASLAALSFLLRFVFLTAIAPLPLPPDALAFRAREILKQSGYTREAADSAYGFYYGDLSYLDWVAQHDSAARWERLASHQPALVRFWYRQANHYLETSGTGFPPGAVSEEAPPQSQPGDVRLILDPMGRLVELSILPDPSSVLPDPSSADNSRPQDWYGLLAAAGLDAAHLTPAAPGQIPPMFADSRMAWTGSYEEGRPDTIRVDAAAWKGRPVYLAITGSWRTAGAAPRSAEPAMQLVMVALLILILAAGLLVAWRNVKAGRSDLRGAQRIAAFLFVVPIMAWALVAGHVPGLWEFRLLVLGLSWALFVAAAVWLMYAAIEPYVRRHWPEALISWVRLIGGRGRDPLAASHVLAGALVGLAALLPHALVDFTANRLPGYLAVQPYPETTALNGPRALSGAALVLLQDSVFLCGAFIFLIVLLRLAIGRNWPADLMFAAIFALASWGVRPLVWHLALEFLFGYCAIWLLRRFGVLSFFAAQFFRNVVVRLPLAVTGFYAGDSLVVIGALVAICAWALYAILRAPAASFERAARVQATLTG